MRPSRAEAARLDTSSPLADPGGRLAARVIDIAAVAVPALVLVPVGIVAGAPNIIRAGFLCAFLVGVGLIFLNILWLQRYGQTLGKRLLGIRIVRTNGERAGLGRILGLRIILTGFLSAIPFLGWVIGLGNALLIFSSERRCLHDRFADTVVIDLCGPR